MASVGSTGWAPVPPCDVACITAQQFPAPAADKAVDFRMFAEHATSEFRIEKGRSRARLTLLSGETVEGCFFVSTTGVRVTGPERIADLLNAEPGLFLFEVHEERTTRTVLYNRSQIVTVAVTEAEARRDPGYDVATERVVAIRFVNGRTTVGSIKVYRPEGRDRVSDWARHPDQFRYMETSQTTLIVNMAHIIEISEIRA
jgi:hypothetical protein